MGAYIYIRHLFSKAADLTFSTERPQSGARTRIVGLEEDAFFSKTEGGDTQLK
jgi:hypothetical protein